MNKPANPCEHTHVAGASSRHTTGEKDFCGSRCRSQEHRKIAPQDACRPQGDQPSTVWVMTDDEFTDPYGFTGPLPVTSTQRMIPTGDFKPGLSVGQPAPDFELPNHLGETVSFHADRDGSRAALLFYRSAVW